MSINGSLIANTSAPVSRAALSTKRPIRPNPFIPIFEGTDGWAGSSHFLDFPCAATEAMAFLTVSSSPKNFMETIGVIFSSNSYTKGMPAKLDDYYIVYRSFSVLPVGRFSFIMASSDKLSRCLTIPRREFPWAAMRILFPSLICGTMTLFQ